MTNSNFTRVTRLNLIISTRGKVGNGSGVNKLINRMVKGGLGMGNYFIAKKPVGTATTDINTVVNAYTGDGNRIGVSSYCSAGSVSNANGINNVMKCLLGGFMLGVSQYCDLNALASGKGTNDVLKCNK